MLGIQKTGTKGTKSKGECGRHNDGPTNPGPNLRIKFLTLRTCESVTLQGKRDLADVLKVKCLKMGRLS